MTSLPVSAAGPEVRNLGRPKSGPVYLHTQYQPFGVCEVGLGVWVMIILGNRDLFIVSPSSPCRETDH